LEEIDVAEKKVTDLTTLTVPAATDVWYVVQGGVSKQMTPETFLASAVFTAAVGSTYAVPSSADSAASNNSIYYSTDQSALSYKDSNGESAAVAPVLPSGDATTDTAAIQAALDAGGAVLLTGNYRLNGTITIPETSSLIGLAKASIIWLGGTTSNYMIVVDGQRRSYALENIWVYGSNTCRNILFDRVWYSPLYRNVRVRGGYEVSVDFIDCWGSHGTDLLVYDFEGIGVRMHRCNSSTFTVMNLQGGADTNWPSAVDTTVTDYRGEYVRTVATRRAPLVIAAEDTDAVVKQDTTLFNTLIFESNVYTSKPLIDGNYSSSRFSNMRFEANESTGPLIKCHGGVGINGLWGSCNTFDGILLMGIVADPSAIVELDNGCRSIMVRNLQSQNTPGAIIACADDGTTHENIKVELIEVPTVNPVDYIDPGASATVVNTDPDVISEVSDARAPNNSIYYSTDQSALCYKDSSGTVTTIDQTATP
jgi:hypothetical protein